MVDNGCNQDSTWYQLFPDKIRSFGGKAGSSFLADTYALHKGVRPEKDRFVCWIRYGLRKNLTYSHDITTPLNLDSVKGRFPDDQYHRYLFRLVISPEAPKETNYQEFPGQFVQPTM